MLGYRGSGPALNDLITGQYDFLCDQIPHTIGHVEAGSVRALAIAQTERSPALPNVPTTTEAGLPQLQASGWNAMFAPKGTPKADRRQARRRRQQGARRSENPQAAGGYRRHRSGSCQSRPAGVAQFRRRRDREMDAGDQGRRRDDQLKAHHDAQQGYGTSRGRDSSRDRRPVPDRAVHGARSVVPH